MISVRYFVMIMSIIVVMGGQGMQTESRELTVEYRWGLGNGSRLGWDSDMMEGQGVVGDGTFHDSDRDVTSAGTWHDEDGDTKAWQGKDKDREAGSWR
jgi:hypothetical protein